jgi:hypothetical protein
MAFRDFTFPQVQVDLGLTVREEDLFADVPLLDPGDEFRATLTEGIDLALAVNTEKARSEFIIAPVLLKLRRMLPGGFGLFSGVLFDVDPGRGLTGFCDFLLTRDRRQFVLSAPVVAVAEAKNDNPWNGLGQCVASMVAAREFNRKAGGPDQPVYGTSTTGSAWRFLRLVGDELTLDVREYFIDNPGKILGILRACLAPPPP